MTSCTDLFVCFLVCFGLVLSCQSPTRIRNPWGQGPGLSYSSLYYQCEAWCLECSRLSINIEWMNEWMNLCLPWSKLVSFIRLQFASSASPLCFLPRPATNLLTHTVSYFTLHLCLAQPFQPALSPQATQWTMCLSWSCFFCCLSDRLELLSSADPCCLSLTKK